MGMSASILMIVKFILVDMFILMKPVLYIRRKKLFDSYVLGTPPGQFISTNWLTLIASIQQSDSIVPSSSKLPHNSVDSSNNNNSGFSFSSSSASQDHINFPSEQKMDILPTPTEPSQPPGRTYPMVLRQNTKKKFLVFICFG